MDNQNDDNLSDILKFMETGEDFISPEPTEETEDNTPAEDVSEVEETEEINDDVEVEEEEEEEVDEVETPTEIEEDEDDSEDLSPSRNKEHYDFLTEEGILQPNEDFVFDGSDESLEEAYVQTRSNQKVSALQEVWNVLPEEFKGPLEFAISGGTSLDEYLEVFHNKESFDDLDLSETTSQRKVVSKYLTLTTKMSPELIKKKIDRMEDGGILEEEATDVLPELQDYTQKEQERVLNEKKDAKIKAHQTTLDKRDSIQDVITNADFIPKARKNKVKAFIFNEVKKGNVIDTQYSRVLDSIYSNPEHLAQLADVLLEYDDKKGLQLDRFIKKGKTAAVSSFSKRLNKRTSDPKNNVKGGRSKITPQKFNLAEALKQFE